MNSTSSFPSTQWFNELAEIMREDAASFEALGSMDCTMVVQLADVPDSKPIEVNFSAYEVESVRDLERIDDAVADHFTITAPREIWREMVDNIIENGQPDLEHTLNFLTFPDDPMVVDGPDQLQIDAFYRYNQSLQLFFNGAAKIA
jgi:hypothetical protein